MMYSLTCKLISSRLIVISILFYLDFLLYMLQSVSMYFKNLQFICLIKVILLHNRHQDIIYIQLIGVLPSYLS